MRRYHHPVLPTQGDLLTLPRDTSHHILQVCRHPRGTELCLFDGVGGEATCTLVEVQDKRAVLACTALRAPCTPTRRVVVMLALCKPAAWETALRMGTELGADLFQPVLVSRCSVRKLRPERWEKLLVAACAQSGRRWLPRLEPLLNLQEALEAPWLPPERLVLAPGAPVLPSPAGDVALLLGPEGGLTDAELEAARVAGFQQAGLATHTLRVDTAVAAALTRYALSCSS